ncbi:MAG: hypothetical protein WCG16_00265 [Methylococcales bacterium]
MDDNDDFKEDKNVVTDLIKHKAKAKFIDSTPFCKPRVGNLGRIGVHE